MHRNATIVVGFFLLANANLIIILSIHCLLISLLCLNNVILSSKHGLLMELQISTHCLWGMLGSHIRKIQPSSSTEHIARTSLRTRHIGYNRPSSTPN